MDNIIQNSKQASVPKIYVEQASQHSYKEPEKEQQFTSFTQYFDNQRDDNNSNSLLNFYNNKGTSLMQAQNTPVKKYGMSPNYNSLLDVPNTPDRGKSNQPSLMQKQNVSDFEIESDEIDDGQMDPLGNAIKKIKMRYYDEQKQISGQKKQKNRPSIMPKQAPLQAKQLFKEDEPLQAQELLQEEPPKMAIPHPSKVFDVNAISQKQKAKEQSQKQMQMYQHMNYQPYYYQ